MLRARPGIAIAIAAAAIASTMLPAADAAPIVPVSTNIGCDPIDPAACLLPFPNDFFTVADETTDTTRRINFSPAAMPRSGTEVTEGGEGKPIDPTEWNRNDGFSPGSMVMTYVDGIDLHQTWGTADRSHSDVGLNEIGYFDHRDHIADIGLYKDKDAPMVILNAETGKRHPFWSEVDTHPNATSAEEQLLILRPAVNFEEGTRYIVALRNLKRADGSVIPAGAAFASLRDETAPTLPELPDEAARRARYESEVFAPLEEAKIEREDLYLAWDFTVASERNLAERILAIRDEAFGALGDSNLADRLVEGSSPEFVIDEIEGERNESWTDSRGVSHTQVVRRVAGRITVPNYLDRSQQTESRMRANELPADPPAPLSRFYDDPVDPDSLPDVNPVDPELLVPFLCDVPLSRDGQPAGEQIPMLEGHGLLGSRTQLGALSSPRRQGPFMGCALDWWGMSTNDIPSVAAMIADMSNFPSLADRAQQGFLNFMFVGRALVHPNGFVTDPAFQSSEGQPLIDTAEPGEITKLHYDGNSQGGIMGGSLVAVSPDIHRGILGVPGMNYSTLLQRSIDWEDLYAIPFYAIYSDPIEQQLAFSLIQMLWDRGEANGFAAHMTDDPLANTPSHEVMLQVAFADHQVTNIAAEVEARTIGAPIMEGLAPGKHWDFKHLKGPEEYPEKGSALIYWDSGNATPPNGNVPATHNGDPHSDPRSEPAAGWQEAQFLLTGWNVDVCDVDNGGFYLTNDHPDNNNAVSCIEPEYAPGSVVPDDAEDEDNEDEDNEDEEVEDEEGFEGDFLAI